MARRRLLSRAEPVRSRRRLGWRSTATGLAALLALLGGALVAVPAAGAATPRAASAPLLDSERLGSFDAQMVSLINGARASAGVSTLTPSGGLTSLAVWWSRKMADGDTGYQLQHNPDAWTMVTQYGASNRTAWAENVAAFSSGASAQAVFDAYMNSSGHRANILSSKYHYVGVGTMSGSHGAFNTMEFTDKVDGAPATTSKAKPKPTTSKARPAPTTSKAKPKPAPTTTSKARPAPTTSKSTPKPAQKPAPTTIAKPKPVPTSAATPDPVTQAMEAQPPAQQPQQVQPARQDARPADNKPATKPAAVRGTLTAAFGALGLPGMKVAIRDADCHGSATVTATTRRNGKATVHARPGTYCAVAVSAPTGVDLPKATTFTVRSGHAFKVTWNHLDTATIWWSARGDSLLCPV